MSVNGIEFDKGSIQGVVRGMEKLPGQLHEALYLVTESAAAQMEGFAKDNAPWTDRTGNARQHLTGKAYWSKQDELICAVFHKMDYGVHLELAHERRYAILEKTVNQYKDELVSAWKKIAGD